MSSRTHRSTARRRYGVVGTGARSQRYVTALLGEHSDVGQLVAWCEPNPARTDHTDALVATAGAAAGPVRRGSATTGMK